MGAVVTVRDLSMVFDKSEPTLENVNVDVMEGEVLGLLGANGGGKSTLLMLMAGLIRPTSGSVEIDGVPASELALTHTGSVGLITAEAGLYPLLSGWENLHYFGGLYRLSREDVEARTRALLEELELTEEELGLPSNGYSSGMRQKVSLARALMLNPRLLLLDEPTANLDPLATRTVHRAVRKQAERGVAVVIVTHNLNAAEHLCDRVIIVKQIIRAEQSFEGERAPPDPGPLYRLYEETLGT
jgi:ABC-type multidrug transport system ATPase subunit